MTPRQLGAGLAGAALLIAGITVLARVAGLARWLVFSDSVGSTAVGNAYLTANQLPNVLFEVAAGGALAGAVVPLLAGPLARGARAEVDRIASALLSWALAVLLPVSVVLALSAGWLVPLVSPRTDLAPGQLELAVRLLLVFSPQVVLYGVAVVLSGVLQSHRRFAWPAVAPLLSSIVVIVAYRGFAATAGGAQDAPEQLGLAAELWLGVGTTAGVAAMSLPLLLPTLRAGVRLRPTFTFPPGVARRARRLAAAGLGALLAQQAAVLAALVLANLRGGSSAFPVFVYVQAVYLLPYAVLVVPLATSAFPRLAELASGSDRAGFARTVARTTRAVLVAAAAGAVALAAAAPAVAAVFTALDRGGQVEGFTGGLTAMAAGSLGFALTAHAARVLYAAERGRSAAAATAAGWLAVVAASTGAVLLLTRDGVDAGGAVVGLGIGSAAGMSVAGVALLRGVRAAAGPAALAGVWRTVGVAALGGSVAVGSGRLVTDGLLRRAEPAASGPVDAGALAAGATGGLLAVAVLAALLAAADPGSVRAVLARRRR